MASEEASIPIDGSDTFTAGADALRVSGANGTNGTKLNGSNGSNGASKVNGSNGDKVIDLRDEGRTRVRVSRDQNPFSSLSKQERMRLIVRVLCEIVAYGEIEDDPEVVDPSAKPAVNG